jgi:phage shock protein PspC (stress-responsive transcriptional regulator)
MEIADPPTESSAPSDNGPRSEERLHRRRDGRMVAGVAAGLADYFGIDPTLVRIGFLVLAVMGGLALPLYVAGWLLIPEEGAEFSLAEDLLSREGRLTGD